MQGGDERAGVAQSGEEKVRINTWWEQEGSKEGIAFLSGAQWKDKRQWAQIVIEEIHFKQTRKSLFILTLVEHWNRLPRGAVESLSLEAFKTWPDTTLNNLL